MKIFKILGLLSLIVFCFGASVRKNPDTRCKRIVPLIPALLILFGIGTAATGVSLIVEEQDNARSFKNMKENQEQALRDLARASSTSRTTTTVMTTTTTTTTTTIPPISGRTILINYELEDFSFIPRTAFLFEVNSVPDHGRFDAEYLLIDPDYTGTTSIDRPIYRVIGDQPMSDPISSTRVNSETLHASVRNLDRLIRQNRRLHDAIIERVASANGRLRRLQEERFVQRAVQLEQGQVLDGSDDRELSRAFFHEFRQLARLFDQRTVITHRLLDEVRNRGCIEFGEAMKKHVKKMGALGVPKFWLDRNTVGFIPLSPEEMLWIQRPSLSWTPDQVQMDASFRSVDENMELPFITQTYPQAGESPEGQFQLPDYSEYNAMFPLYGERILPNARTIVWESLFPGQVEPDSDDEYGTEIKKILEEQEESTINPEDSTEPSIEDSSSDQGPSEIIFNEADDDSVQIIEEMNRTIELGNSDGDDECEIISEVTFKKRRFERSIYRHVAASCSFRGGRLFSKFLQLF